MKSILSHTLLLAATCAFLNSCGNSSVPAASLTANEQSLLNALNAKRARDGKQPLQASADLTELARKDAARRVAEGSDYKDNRSATGYEKLVTLSGKGRPGQTFGYTLMSAWTQIPQQEQWISGNYANAGVGTAPGADGLETGVLLLGGYSANSSLLGF
ncbi:MAG: hypothetical protein Q7Q71_16185 [Verrucomicrobiota bacterium JB023]|nr:hypothetical protein [Verrucomicrobiota bacterium JB023]